MSYLLEAIDWRTQPAAHVAAKERRLGVVFQEVVHLV
jgi:hypothetical protein